MSKISREQALINIQKSALGQGFELTPEQVEEMVKTFEAVLDEFINCTDGDTVAREKLQQAIAKTFVGMDWPIYADGAVGWNSFVLKVQEGAAAGKYKILPGSFRLEKDH